MRRPRSVDTDRDPPKRDVHHYLRTRLKKKGISTKGTTHEMQEKLELHSKNTKDQLIQMIKELCGAEVKIPNATKLFKRDLVDIIPKIKKAQGQTHDHLIEKLHRLHQYVHEMPATTASKDKLVTAYAQAVLLKSIGIEAESDKEAEIDALFTADELRAELNSLDAKNIHFPPSTKKKELVHAYKKYILDLNEPKTRNRKSDLMEIIRQNYPAALPLSSVNKRELIKIIAAERFHEDYGGELLLDPETMHRDQLVKSLEEHGFDFASGLLRDQLVELYNVFLYKGVGDMTKTDIRHFLDAHKVPHNLEKSPKSDHEKAYFEYMKTKYFP